MLVKIKGVEHPLDPGKLTFGEGRTVQRVSGMKFGEWSKALGDGDIEALAAYNLVLLQRSEPGARMADIDAMAITDVEYIAEDDDEPASADAAEVVEDPTSAAQ